MLIFLIFLVSAIGFCGFFLKWSFRDDASQFGFVAMMENSAKRPFIHRQLLPVIVKKTVEILPPDVKEKLSKNLIEKKHIEKRFAKSEIPDKYVLEYYLMFALCFICFAAAIWILRGLLSEILQDEIAGTVGAMLFAILFPFFESLGGYYYDILEFLFMFLAVRFVLHGNFIALFILVPIAEWNKESFLFFLATLYPLIRQHADLKKSAIITLGAMFSAGLAYLYVRQMFLNNPGDMADWRVPDHLKSVFEIKSYFHTDSIYGIPFGSRIFLPHVIFVIWIIKNSWCKLSECWKSHAKFALVINGALYFLFVVPGELRDLSMLYMTFALLTAYYLRDIFKNHYQKT